MSIIERYERKICNMRTMLTRIGIDPATFAQVLPETLFTIAMRTCQRCPRGEICHDLLAHAVEKFDHVPTFCPNAQRFECARKLMTQKSEDALMKSVTP